MMATEWHQICPECRMRAGRVKMRRASITAVGKVQKAVNRAPAATMMRTRMAAMMLITQLPAAVMPSASAVMGKRRHLVRCA